MFRKCISTWNHSLKCTSGRNSSSEPIFVPSCAVIRLRDEDLKENEPKGDFGSRVIIAAALQRLAAGVT